MTVYVRDNLFINILDTDYTNILTHSSTLKSKTFYQEYKNGQNGKDQYECSLSNLPSNIQPTFKLFDYIHDFFAIGVPAYDLEIEFFIDEMPCDSTTATDCSSISYNYLLNTGYDLIGIFEQAIDQDAVSISKSSQETSSVYSAYLKSVVWRSYTCN